MITFIRLINISINVALKSLYSVSVIPHWGIYTERSHPDALLRELSAGRSFRVWSVQKIAPLKACPSWSSSLLAPIDAWRKGQAILAQCRAVCDPELYTGLAIARYFQFSSPSILAFPVTSTSADLFSAHQLSFSVGIQKIQSVTHLSN